MYKELRLGPRGSADLDRVEEVLTNDSICEFLLNIFDLYAAVTVGTDTDAFLTLTLAGFHLFSAHSGIVQVPGKAEEGQERRISPCALKGSDIDTVYIQAQVQTKRLQDARAIKASRMSGRVGSSGEGIGGRQPFGRSGKGKGGEKAKGKVERVILPPEPPDRSLHRWQFIECIVRIAHDMYVRSSHENTLSSAILRLVNEDLKRRLPFFLQIAGDKYRRKRLYTLAVDDAIRPNLATLRRLHSTYASPSASFFVEVPVRRGKALLKAVAGALRMRLALMGSLGSSLQNAAAKMKSNLGSSGTAEGSMVAMSAGGSRTSGISRNSSADSQ